MNTMEKTHYTVEEFSQATGVPKHKIYYAIKANALPTVKMPKTPLARALIAIPKSEIAKLQEEAYVFTK